MAKRKVKADCRADTRGGSWAGIPKCLIDSAAYRDLSLHARAALIELVARMNGYNNGSIAVSHRELITALGCSARYIVSALAELMSHGMIDVAVEGQWKARKARQYRLTFVTTKTGPATNDYLRWTSEKVKSGASHGEARKGQSASHGEARREHPASYGEAARATKQRKSAIPENPPASHGEALIDKPYPPAPSGEREGGFGPFKNPFSTAGHRSETETVKMTASEPTNDQPESDEAKPRMPEREAEQAAALAAIRASLIHRQQFTEVQP